MQDSIERSIALSASPERVWQALSDHRQFGEWFGVEIERPFVVGETSRGRSYCNGCEGNWEVTVVALEPLRRFAFEWCPYEYDATRDFARAPKTRVEFTLVPTGHGTEVTIRETGFAALPADAMREQVLSGNAQAWVWQSDQLAAYVT